MSRVVVNCRVIPATQYMLLDAPLLNTHHYKIRIKGKMKQSWELGVVAIENGTFGSPSTTVANFTFKVLLLYIIISARL